MSKLIKKLNVHPRFLFTIFTVLIIAVAASIAIFLAKGYRFSPQKGTFTGTGIMSITSVPDQASVYLDDHLTTATNANINSLVPKKYKVRIVKEGFIAWEKEIEVKEGLVSEIKATLFPAIPTIYPLTYNGVVSPTLSPDSQKLAFVVPGQEKKSGIWVWTMSETAIAFARGNEPHQIALATFGPDYTKAKLRFSPDSSELLVTLPDRTLLLDPTKLNDPPRDITAILQPTLKGWEEDQAIKNLARIQTIKNLNLRKVASSSGELAWSPDETKFFYCEPKEDCSFQKKTFKVVDLTERKIHTLPQALSASWLADSRHLVLVEMEESSSKISVVEFDGSNQAILFAGTFDPIAVYPWPDGSRLMIVSSFPIPTAEQPNLFGINLK